MLTSHFHVGNLSLGKIMLLKEIFVTGSGKRGLIADSNSTHLETRNLTCEFGATLKLGPKIPLL